MELYHILNRGVEKRNLFVDKKDFARFVHDLYEFNDVRPAGSTYYNFEKNLDLRNPDMGGKKRERIIDLHGWCLMKNHYHLLLSERREGGLSLFLRKLNVGYANYFNERYRRSGTLFQGRTKKILIDSHPHSLYILNYIHLNPLDYFKGAEHWRERDKSGIQNAKRALNYLQTYRWSSYLDYCGVSNVPSILTKGLYRDLLGNYPEAVAAYLADVEFDSLNSLKNLTLE